MSPFSQTVLVDSVKDGELSQIPDYTSICWSLSQNQISIILFYFLPTLTSMQYDRLHGQSSLVFTDYMDIL